jgi:hypothetical protein
MPIQPMTPGDLPDEGGLRENGLSMKMRQFR